MARVALVTGGTTGIGAAISRALKAAGHIVVANCLPDMESQADAFRRILDLPVSAWDVADFAACTEGVARVAAEYGPVEILVNNAGITRDAMLHKMTQDQWRQVLDVDLGGCFNMCAVIESMRERRFGRIVNISSVNALSGQAGQTNYAAAKAGMIGFTKALALESAARDITVNAIAPGYTRTGMVDAVPAGILKNILDAIPAKRLAQPEEIARAVVFLAAEEAGFITGETLSVNGGKYMQ